MAIAIITVLAGRYSFNYIMAFFFAVYFKIDLGRRKRRNMLIC
jgi:hypothetical protein